MLRRVNRRWYATLEYEVVDERRCMHMAILWRMRVNLGNVVCEYIGALLREGYYDILMGAEYTWYIAAHDDAPWNFLADAFTRCKDHLAGDRQLHRELCARYCSCAHDGCTYNTVYDAFIPLKCNFLENLFIHILSKAHKSALIIKMILKLDNARIVEETHKLGFSFGGNAIISAESAGTMKAIHDLGTRGPITR